MSQNEAEAKVQRVSVVTNQFKMAIGGNAPQMYQYPLRLAQDAHKDDSPGDGPQCSLFEMQKIVEQEKRKIEMLIGKFLTSGFNLWTEQQIEETLVIPT